MSTEPAARTRNLPSVEEVSEAIYNAIPDPDCSWLHLDEGARNTCRIQARAVLALFAPETVTTADELDALPQDAGILDANGVLLQRQGSLVDFDVVHSAWAAFLSPSLRASNEVVLPATVIYRPEEDA